VNLAWIPKVHFGSGIIVGSEPGLTGREKPATSLATLRAFFAAPFSLALKSQPLRFLIPMSTSLTSPERQRLLDTFPQAEKNTTPGDAALLRILIQATGAKRGVEVGSFAGYGAVNMGIAFERTGGRLITIDVDPAMVQTTRENITRFGLEGTVTAIGGDAAEVLRNVQGPFDFVFLDAAKPDYLRYFEAIRPQLAEKALLVADNVIAYADAMRDFLEFMAKSPEWEMVIVRASEAKGDGMAVCRRVT